MQDGQKELIPSTVPLLIKNQYGRTVMLQGQKFSLAVVFIQIISVILKSHAYGRKRLLLTKIFGGIIIYTNSISFYLSLLFINAAPVYGAALIYAKKLSRRRAFLVIGIGSQQMHPGWNRWNTKNQSKG